MPAILLCYFPLLCSLLTAPHISPHLILNLLSLTTHCHYTHQAATSSAAFVLALMPSLPAAVLLLVLSAARWQTTLQQQQQPGAEQDDSAAHLPASPDLSTASAALSNHSLTTKASELLSSALVALLSIASSLAHSLPAALDSLHDELSALSLQPVVTLLTSTPTPSTTSSPHDHTVAVLWFLVVALLVLTIVVGCLTLAAWQRYAAPIAAFREEWHSTRARRKERRTGRREKGSAEEKREQSSDKEGEQPTAAAPAFAAPAGADSSSSSRQGGRQTSDQPFGFMSRVRAFSEAEDDVEMKTPTVIMPGRDPFSQIRRKY